MKTERELFLEWHFLDWKLHNAVTDTLEYAKVLYERIYLHVHNSTAREQCYVAWQASAKRDGFKLVPLKPSFKQLDALKNSCQLFKSAGVSDFEAHQAYCDMLSASDEVK